MTSSTKQRVPFDEAYVTLLGRAIYAFAYYEWAIIWIVEHFEPGFVRRYSRGKAMTSMPVARKFKKVLDVPMFVFASVSKQELGAVQSRFEALVHRRNALVHAHPCTDEDGAQILTYQGEVGKPLPDMRWPVGEVEALLIEIDDAACEACNAYDRLQQSSVKKST